MEMKGCTFSCSYEVGQGELQVAGPRPVAMAEDSLAATEEDGDAGLVSALQIRVEQLEADLTKARQCKLLPPHMTLHKSLLSLPLIHC